VNVGAVAGPEGSGRAPVDTAVTFGVTSLLRRSPAVSTTPRYRRVGRRGSVRFSMSRRSR